MDVEFVAGNDSGQALGAWMSWNRWCWETHGRDIDHAAWMTAHQGKVGSGCFTQIVGWDGCEPVAMLEIRVGYDPCEREQMAFGDHAWVHPDYRKEGVMRGMFDFAFALTELFEVYILVAPATAGKNASAPWLRQMYESYGFELDGVTLTRNRLKEAA